MFTQEKRKKGTFEARHLRVIAAALAKAKADAKPGAQQVGVYRTAATLILEIEETTPRFNRKRFLKAANLDDLYSEETSTGEPGFEFA